MSLIRTLSTAGLLALTSTGAANALQDTEKGAAPAAVSTPPVEAEIIPAESDRVSFVAVGDSGYESPWFSFFGSWYGIRAQHWAPGESGLPVMGPMLQNFCGNNSCQFGVMLGDNIYPDGVDGIDPADDQKRYDKVFIEPFAPLLNDNPSFRIFPTLGNHDWRGKRKGALAQVEFLKNTPPFDMRGLFYSVKPEGTKGKVEVFVIDTEMLLSMETVYEPRLNDKGHENRDLEETDDVGKNVGPLSDTEKNQLKWLEKALQASRADWKIVIGHHPLWSSGSTKFEQAHALKAILLPTLCKYADAYFAGHEHSLEVAADTCETMLPEDEAKPLLHILSGAFAKSRPMHQQFMAYQQATYPQLDSQFVSGKVPEGEPHEYKQVFGFAHVSVLGDKATIRILSHIEDTAIPEQLMPAFECVFDRRSGFGEGGCMAQQATAE